MIKFLRVTLGCKGGIGRTLLFLNRRKRKESIELRIEIRIREQTTAHRRATQRGSDTELISDLPARGNPRVRLARDQCIPPGALLTGGLGKAKI